MIMDCVNKKEWRPIKMGRRGVEVSHLLFADDLLLFYEASIEQMQKVLKVLEAFGDMSGQKLNVQKTSIFFSKNTDRRVQNEICKLAGFKRMENLGRYLGAFITRGRS